jgi:hypothetical protein
VFLFRDTLKFVFTMNTDCHLYTLSETESDDNNDTSSDESDLEVISTVDETDHIAVSIMDHFNINDDEEDKCNDEAINLQQLDLALNSSNTELDEDVDDQNAAVVPTDQLSLLTSSSAVTNSVGQSPSCKRKRRQWSAVEKLRALDMMEKAGGNKRRTSEKISCSRYQLSQWKKQKEDLILLSNEIHGELFSSTYYEINFSYISDCFLF